MTRVTHDRLLDHDNTDLDTNVLLDGALSAPASTASGATVHQALTDLNSVLSGTSVSWKAPVRVATTANGTLSTAFANGQTVDGVTLATGDRILIKDQGTPSQNGIYIVAVSGAPARASDFNSQASILGSVVVATNGTTNGDTVWLCTANAPITVGSTSLPFAQVGGGGGGGSLTVEQIGGSPSTTSVTVIQVGSYNDNGGGDVTLYPQITGTDAGNLNFAPGYTQLLSPDAGTLVSIGDTGNGTFIQGIASPSALSGVGIEMMVGTSLIGFIISQESSTSVQIYDDASGGHDISFVDQGSTHHWRFVSAAGDASIPALGRLRVLSSAPSSPTEGDSYYDSTLHLPRYYNGTIWVNF